MSMQNPYNPNRHFLALAAGIIGGLLPNKRSNIHPLLMGTALALLFSKVIFGDYDKGYQYTISDVYFVFIVGIEGCIGAYLTSFHPK